MPNLISGIQLRAARIMAGLKQTELSIQAGFAPRACRYWESRKEKPPTDTQATLVAIEAVLRRHGVEVFSLPTAGCRLVSTK